MPRRGCKYLYVACSGAYKPLNGSFWDAGAALSIAGMNDVIDLRQQLGDLYFDVVLASPLIRAQQTASRLAKGARIQTVEEVGPGDESPWWEIADWMNQHPDESVARQYYSFPDFYRNCMARICHIVLPLISGLRENNNALIVTDPIHAVLVYTCAHSNYRDYPQPYDITLTHGEIVVLEFSKFGVPTRQSGKLRYRPIQE